MSHTTPAPRPDRCELCERHGIAVDKHHLIPKTRHKNKRNKKNFDRDEVKERVLWLCAACHRTIHATLTEKQLEYDYNTREKLLEHPDVFRFVDWVRARPPDTKVAVRRSSAAEPREKIRRLQERRMQRRQAP